jgi:hypothetical protein
MDVSRFRVLGFGFKLETRNVKLETAQALMSCFWQPVAMREPP